MAEKSNATLPDSQVTYHIASNGCDYQGRAVEDGQYNLIYTCVLCNNNVNDINLHMNGKNGTRLSPNEVYYNCQTTFYEPVLIEPLTFTNGSEFNPPMWNLDNFELTYNFDNLDNMIIINKHAIIKKLAMRVRNPRQVNENIGTGADHVGATTTYERAGSYNDNDNDLFLAEPDAEVKWSDILSGLQVSFIGKPQLIYYVYTPIPGNEPRLPYMAPYKEFKRYRYSSTSSTVKRRELVKGYNDNNVPTMYFDTGRIDMVYYPHSIYLYVGEANANRMSSLENRVTHPESFARITKVNCIYGNCTTILDSFKDLDFYNMSLRNGLKGRAYYDWLIVNSSMGLPESYSYVKDPSENNAVAGIGSVVRLTPGIDLHTGGMTGRMIGGCPAVSKSITFQVQAKPLDIFTQGSKEYELYVIFEQQSALVMQDGQCRVGLVGCESVEWYDMQPLAQVTCDYNMYGSEVGGGSFFTKARKAMKKGVDIVKKGAEHNLFSSALGAAANITGNSHVGNAAQYARRFEGLAAKRPALADPNAEPASGAGFRKRRFYH